MLSKNVTKASQERYQVAKELIEKCPISLAKEIALTGSVSRGVADDFSDIEIIFWAEEIPSEKERMEWIKEVGGTDLKPYKEPIADGSMWIIFYYEGYWIEAGWQNISLLKEHIEEILTGNVVNHERLILASIIKNAKPLRSDDVLLKLQQELDNYPEELQIKLINPPLQIWTLPLIYDVFKALSHRDDRIPLVERLTGVVRTLLRILYALNKEWEPDWKWIDAGIQNLEIKPIRMSERIKEIFAMSDPIQSTKMVLELFDETIQLIPEKFDQNDIFKIIRTT